MVGYVPRYSTRRGHATLTLKQNYIPWSLYASDRFSFDPLYGGIYLNTIFGHEFWGRQPGRYPSGYYWFSTKLRTHIFWGCRATWHPGIRRKYWIKGSPSSSRSTPATSTSSAPSATTTSTRRTSSVSRQV